VPEVNVGAHGLNDTTADQVNHIVAEFGAKEIEIDFATDHGPSFMYAKGQLIVQDSYLDPVRAILDEHREQFRYVEERLIAGVVLIRLVQVPEDEQSVGDQPPPGDQQPAATPQPPSRGEPYPVLDLLDEIDARLGEGIATPNHVLTVANGLTGPCPATEPQEVYYKTEPYPAVCRDGGGAGVLIYIADTGLLKDAREHHRWLHGVAGELDPLTEAEAGTGTGTTILPYAGHGTFVAGVVRCMAPEADIIVGKIFYMAGSQLESCWVKELNAALRFSPDIFHLSMAAPTRKDLPLVTFVAWKKLVDQYKGVVCVVAAGNYGTRRPTWPAAYPGTVAVGALAADWCSRADFSSYGGWVDVYAPGRDLVNAYAKGEYICHEAPYKNDKRKFHGMAKWSGTSFSTPIVTGLIAARMSRCGESAEQAATALLVRARAQAIPGVGPILLPSCGGEDDEGRGGCGHCGDRGCGRGRCGCGCGGCGRGCPR
jgi:hypothetical protein